MGTLCFVGGAAGYARTRSIPSMVAGLALGSMFMLSGLRIKEGMSYGYEGATGTSLALVGAMVPRAIKTRGPIPIALATAGTAAGGYYAKAVRDYSL
ncbi:hypothetical protein FFLO_02704 [Filobasidium floriforme]|uniref:Transmembrane protein 14C n=2 Tax=Filobasidium floriforme TaxID=5210 RepID=A0A8K0NTU2_9TREE|nr:hypothetical protein FFLO_02704 [Filobasidium floriforme]